METKLFKKIGGKSFKLIQENTSQDADALYVEYLKDMPGEEPFTMGGQKFQYVWAKYPSGKQDIGVYAYSGDVVYGYQSFRERYNINGAADVKSVKEVSWHDEESYKKSHGDDHSFDDVHDGEKSNSSILDPVMEKKIRADMRKLFSHTFQEPLLSKVIDDAIQGIKGIKKQEDSTDTTF